MTKKLKPRADPGYNQGDLHDWSDAALLSAFLTAVDLARLKDGDFYATIDGTGRPFYGLTKVNDEEADESRITSAGANAIPAFTTTTDNGKRVGSPQYPGTLAKHSWIQLNLHLYDTQETFPLVIRHGRAIGQTLEDMRKALECLPIKPAVILADKEFATATKTGPLSQWCRTNRVTLIFARTKDGGVQKIIKHDWQKRLIKPMRGPKERKYWTVRRHFWRNHSDKTAEPYNLLVVYEHRDPRKAALQPPDVLRLPHGVWAYAFYVNIEVTDENVHYLAEHYRLRWACENLHARWKRYCGVSFSHGMFLRDFFQAASMVMLSAYALWRLERRLRLNLDPGDGLLSHSRYFGAMSINATRRLLAG